MSAVRENRMVHARSPGLEVVRYDRTSKWYIEFDEGTRRQVPISEAVDYAVSCYREWGGTIIWDRPGGRRFDVLAERALEESDVAEG